MVVFLCMGLISKIKSFFNKTVGLDTKNKDDLVVLLKGASGKIKVGTQVQIENGYRLVATHYNNVCDILHEGTYKVENLDMPKLFYLCQKRVLGKNYKSIIADLYCVNLKEYKNIVFRSGVFVKTYNGKKNIKISGEFAFRVADVQKFMQKMCEEYAVVKSKAAMRDISYIVASEISYILRKNLFDLSSIMSNSEELKTLLLDKLKQLEKSLGVSISDVVIFDVDVPLALQRELDTIKSISNLDGIFAQNENDREEIFVRVPNTQSFAQGEAESSAGANEVKRESFSDFESQESHSSYQSPYFEPLGESPKVFEEEEKSAKEEAEQSSQNDEGDDSKKELKYKTCPCCGAKNFEGATNCCVCNSKL